MPDSKPHQFGKSFTKITHILLVLIISALLIGCAQKPANPDFDKIKAELMDLVANFNGDVGIYVKHLPTGGEIEINADTIFPTASMVKVPIMVRIFELMEKSELHYDSTHVYEDRLYYPGSDVVASFKDDETLSLHKMLFLSISFSDNTASLWLQELAGSGTMINDKMSRLGLEHTRVNSRTEGRADAFRKYGWGQTTPREMAKLMEMIYKGQVVSKAQSEEMFRLMSKSLWDKDALASIPKHINVASKQGAVRASRSEIVLVNAHSGDYVFCVVTKNQSDLSFDHENEGYVLKRNVSKVLWESLGQL